VGWSFFAKEIFAFTSFVPTLEKTQNIKPHESIAILFSKPVLDNSYREQIRITPSLPFYAKWENNQTRLVLTPKTLWTPETTYTFALPEGNAPNPFSGNPQSISLSFTTVPHPKVLEVTPKNGAKEIVLDIEDPVSVTFETPLEDFWIDFEFLPTLDVTYQNNPEKTKFDILPKFPLAPGTLYTMNLFSRVTGDNTQEPKKIFQTSFTTLLPPPDEPSKDPAERLKQAQQFTQPKILEGKYIDIDIASQTMVTFKNGMALDAYLVSSGKRGMDTPKGSFQIHNKAPKPWSKQYSLFMPNWMAITPDGKYGIHELPEWPGGYKEGANHLGTPVSHGCVRLGVGSAKRVYDWAEVGTPVVIH
jgi:lipoprotein-anchoring transpeptidase ErfK/SrfK